MKILRTQRPPTGTSIDWSNRLTSGLIVCAPLWGTLENSCNNKYSLVNGSTGFSWGIGTYNPEAQNPTAAVGAKIVAFDWGTGVNTGSILMVVRPTIVDANVRPLWVSAASAYSGGYIYNNAFATAGDAANWIYSATPATNAVHNVLWSMTNGGYDFCWNGKLAYTGPWGVALATYDVTFSYDSLARNAPGGYQLIAIWNRKLLRSEAMEISGNPWQLFKPRFASWKGIQAATNSYSVIGTGGIADGGYSDRISAWTMPAIGGLLDGGSLKPGIALQPLIGGGISDGGDTAIPMAWDTFTGSSGTLLTAHASDDGGSWIKHPSYSAGDARLNSSNQVVSTNSNAGVFLHSLAHSSADYSVSVDITNGGVSDNYPGLCARWNSSAQTGYYTYITLSITKTITLTKVVSGTTTDLGTTSSFSWSTGATKRLTLSVQGSSLSVYLDGVLKLGPITDTDISAVGFAGLYTRGTTATLDNWTSTGGGVQARYSLSTAGGEELGGKYGAFQVYIQVASGGMRDSGHLDSAVLFSPSIAGGIRDGGRAPSGLVFGYVATGGMTDGGYTLSYVSFLATGGITAGGETAAPHFAFNPSAVGGVRDSGNATSVGTYLIEPSGGIALGGMGKLIAFTYYVYANDGAGGPIDYTSPIGSTIATTYTTGTLTGPAVWSYGVRAYSPQVHLEEKNVDAVVTVRLDAAANDITNIPAPVLGLTGHAGKSGTAILSWHYQTSENGKAPTQFRVYQGVGSVSYGSPVTTAPYYAGLRVFQATVSGLTGGTVYLFSVRAANSTGEEQNTSTVAVQAETIGPDAVMSVVGSAIA